MTASIGVMLVLIAAIIAAIEPAARNHHNRHG